MAILKIRDKDGNIQDVVAIRGKDGKDGAPGKDGEAGKDYVLTEADKEEIAQMAADITIEKLPVYNGEVEDV